MSRSIIETTIGNLFQYKKTRRQTMEKRKSLLCLVGTSSLRNSLKDKQNVFYKNVFSLIQRRNDKDMLDKFSKNPEVAWI